jgi:hypothetical protein
VNVLSEKMIGIQPKNVLEFGGKIITALMRPGDKGE